MIQNNMVQFRSLKRAAIALAWVLFSLSNVGFVVANEDVGLEVEEGEAAEEGDVPVAVTFMNEYPDVSIELFWENHDVPDDHPERRKLEGVIPPRGGSIDVHTFLGHEFSYDLADGRHYVVPPEPNSLGEQFIILAGESPGFRVRCEISTQSRQFQENLDILVKPYWAPRGASRFLALVRLGYYDGVCLNRVVPNFLTQFGIGKNYEIRTALKDDAILDDFPVDLPFEPGFVSFAGSGPDSRSAEIFIVMPKTSQQQLDYFGVNPWETPFAVVEGDLSESPLNKVYSGYGDMPPWGNGPDSNKIYDIDGYEYLAQNYPKLDYIERCFVVDEFGINTDYSQGDEF